MVVLLRTYIRTEKHVLHHAPATTRVYQSSPRPSSMYGMVYKRENLTGLLLEPRDHLLEESKDSSLKKDLTILWFRNNFELKI